MRLLLPKKRGLMAPHEQEQHDQRRQDDDLLPMRPGRPYEPGLGRLRAGGRKRQGGHQAASPVRSSGTSVIAAPTRFGARVGASELGDDPAAVHHQHAVAHAQNLRQLAGDHQDRETLLGQTPHQGMDLGFGADVDAARRLVHDEHARFGGKPFGEHHLLLVAAGQLPDDLLGSARADSEALDGLDRAAEFGAAIDHGSRRDPVDDRH